MKVFKWILSSIFNILSCIIIYIIYSLHLLPIKYFILIIIGLIILNILATLCLVLRSKPLKILVIINYIIILLMSYGVFTYGLDTLKFLNNGFSTYTKEITTYNILTLSSSEINDLSSLSGLVGYTEDGLVTKHLNVNLELITYDDLSNMYLDLIDGKIQAMIIDYAYYDILNEAFEELATNTKTIYSFEVESEKENKGETKIVSLKPINVYISGSDSRTETVYSKSRSDANLVVTINPNTRHILITSIPRDYYVQAHGQVGLKEKLTHVGVYGLEMSTMTVEDLFDINVDYSIKVGFSGIIKIVDMIDGVDVYSNTAFTSFHLPSWQVEKGINHLDGIRARAYCGERYAYPDGDRHRAQNQAQVLGAIVNKISTNKSLLLKSMDILNELTNYYITDIPKELISLYIKEQLDNLGEWSIEFQAVSGSDAYDYCYIGPTVKRYVMYPYPEDVERASSKIKELLNE